MAISLTCKKTTIVNAHMNVSFFVQMQMVKCVFDRVKNLHKLKHQEPT